MESLVRDKPLNSTAQLENIRSIGKNPAQTESQQLPAGLFRVPARPWPPINVPSSDNNCGKGACCLGNRSNSECESLGGRDWWLKGAAFWSKPFDGADVQCSFMSEFPAVSIYRVISPFSLSKACMVNRIVTFKIHNVWDSKR